MSARDVYTRGRDRLAVVVDGRISGRSRIGRALRQIRPGEPRRAQPHALARLIKAYGRVFPKTFFVQIGSNDGQRRDPLHDEIVEHDWTGIMVEPVPYIFDRLQAHQAGNPHITVDNVAIADADGYRDFYYLRDDPTTVNLPDWYDQLGSFRRDVVESHRTSIPDIDDRIVQVEVPCLTFDSLAARHGVTHVDVIHIDTEGYDFEIIKLIDFERYQPKLVMFEHYHLSADVRAAAAEIVRAHQFDTVSNGMDTVCLRRDVLHRHRRLQGVWRDAQAELAPFSS